MSIFGLIRQKCQDFGRSEECAASGVSIRCWDVVSCPRIVRFNSRTGAGRGQDNHRPTAVEAQALKAELSRAGVPSART